MIEVKIMERWDVRSRLLRRLEDVSDDQCKAITQNNAMINTYKCTDSVLTQTFGKSKERCCESFIQKTKEGVILGCNSRVSPSRRSCISDR